MSDSESDAVPLWWVVLFIVLALGAGAATVLAVGGSLVANAVALPLFVPPV
jgi:predicted secreted protein